MAEISEEKLREHFRELLIELSDPKVNLEDLVVFEEYVTRLENIYNSDCNGIKFGHYYSDIFQVLTSVKMDKSPVGRNLETLGLNITHIKEQYQPTGADGEPPLIDITHNLRKLWDHISLDMARLQYSDAADWKISQEGRYKEIQKNVDITQDAITGLMDKFVELQNKAEDTAKKLDRSQREYVAVLGIFSSVVLTFIGGIGFSSSVLETMKSVSIYRLLFIVDGLAAVLLNMTCFLMSFIYQIVKDEKPGFSKIHKKMNITFIVIALMIFGAWLISKPEVRSFFCSLQASMGT